MLPSKGLLPHEHRRQNYDTAFCEKKELFI